MKDEDLLTEDNQKTDYLGRVLEMLHPYEKLENYTFCLWINKFEYVADMIDIPDDKMVDIFNKMVDNNVQKLIKKENLPVNFTELSYDEILNYYFCYFDPTDVMYFYRNRLLNRYQYLEEPVEKYANNLQKIYNKCKYIDPQKKFLCAKFIHGLNDDKLKTHIIKFSTLTFNETIQKVLEIAEFYGQNDCECEIAGEINTYSPGNEGIFYIWLNKFEYVADVLKLSDYTLVEYFNNMVDDDVHTNVKNAYNSINFSELSYEEIIGYYLRYFDSSNEIYIHRKRFLCRTQYAVEAIENYAKRLDKIYNKCYYDDILEKVLSRRFVLGLRDDIIKISFLERSFISYVDLVSKAIEFNKFKEENTHKSQNVLTINIYNSENEGTFCEWLNKFEYIVKKAKFGKLNILEFFNETIDNDVHEAVKKANRSVNFCELFYDEMIDYYLRYFASPDETDLHRKRFLHRNQYEKETIKEYSDSLWKIYNKCNNSNDPEEVICERFLNGIYDDEIKTILKKLPLCSSFKEMEKFASELISFKKKPKSLNPSLSNLQTFHQNNKDAFYEWINKFEYVADVIMIPCDELVKFFNEMVDNGVHTDVKEANITVNFSILSYDEMINYYLRYFDSSSVDNLHRSRFLYRYQYEQETIKDYANSLWKIYDKCNYTDSSDERLCEQFRKGLLDDELRLYLCKFRNLSFDVTLALSLTFSSENFQYKSFFLIVK